MDNHDEHMCFKITFPLFQEFNGDGSITFNLKNSGNLPDFINGIYYLHGDNGSGKSTFLSMLALLSGYIGKTAKRGTIEYGSYSYNDKAFDNNKAARIREKYFCIFSQEVFFLNGPSVQENYNILNGGNENNTLPFKEKYPYLLSGGQQQRIFMDIILQNSKKVWFLDEPFNNLDAVNTHNFWKLLGKTYSESPKIIFIVDHHGIKEIVKRNDETPVFHTIGVIEAKKNDKTPVRLKKWLCNFLSLFNQNFKKNVFCKDSEEERSEIKVLKIIDPLNFIEMIIEETRPTF